METPIVFVEGNENRIWMKRDDMIPFSFGGNKARKAVNFFHEIDKGEYDCVVTYGSGGSNHCRVISNMAVSRGLPCYIISPQEASEPTFNSKMMGLFGAQITVVPVNRVHDTIEDKLSELKESGKKPYFIAGGGHGNLGTQAYVDCYKEILSYETREKMHFDYIFFASGTGTTQAGLVCGKLMNHDERSIIGISIARKNPSGRQVVLNSVSDYLKEKQIEIALEEIDVETNFIDEYTDLGYGKAAANVIDTIRRMLVLYGIPLDQTYTGKAYAGMTDYLGKNQIQGQSILFIHTGGVPLFFDDLENRL